MFFFESIENKGESDNFSQINPMKNCAIRDGMAQLKLKWHKFGGAVYFGDMHFTKASVPKPRIMRQTCWIYLFRKKVIADLI